MAVQRDKVIASAEKLVAKGKIEPAIKEYERLLDDNPNDVNTLNRIGDLWVRINRTDEAVKVFGKIADHYSRDGFFLKAIAIYKKINKLDPSKLDVYAKLADLYAKQGLAMEAKSQYQVLADYYLKHGDPGNALSTYRKISELDPNSINVHVKLADLYSQNNQTAEALKEYDRVGRMLLKRGMLDEAVQVFRKALKIDSSNVALAESLVATLVEARDFDNSIQILQSSLESNPDHPKLLALLGRSYIAKGDLNTAKSTVGRGVQKNPADPALREVLSEIYLRLDSPDQALQAMLPLVDAAVAKSNGRAAADMLNKILKIDSGHIPTLEKLVSVFTQLKEETYILASMNSLAEAHIARNNFQNAGTVLRDLIKREPENAQHREKLAFVEQQMSSGAAPAPPPSRPSRPPAIEPQEIDMVEEIQLDSAAGMEIPDDLSLDLDSSEPIDLDLSLGEPSPMPPPPTIDEPGTATPGLEDEMGPGEDLDFITEHLTEAEVFAKYGLAEKAIEHLKAVVTRAPRHLPAYEKLFRIYLDEGEQAEAASIARPYLQLLRERGDLAEASAVEAELAERGIAAAPEPGIEVPEPVKVPPPKKPEPPITAPRKAAPPPREAVTPPKPTPAHVEEEKVEVEEPEVEFDLDGLSFDEELTSVPEAPPPVAPPPRRATPPTRAAAPRPAVVEPLPEETIPEMELGEPVAPEEPFFGVEAVVPPLAIPILPDEPPIEELGEIDFYFEQELFDEAGQKLEILAARFPDHDEISSRRERIDAAASAASARSAESSSPAKFSPADIESELLSAIPMDDDLVSPSTLERPQEPPRSESPAVQAAVAAEGNLFADEDDFFDLAAELEEELGEDNEEPVSLSDEEQSLEEIFREFKKGVEQQLDSEDYDTHYNLGIAYKEMGLIDEAIGEFQLASKDPKKTIECCSMLGLCFLEKGMPQLAIKWYQKGLEVPEIKDEEHLGLTYDLGSVYMEVGDTANAQKALLEVYGLNSNYRDIVGRIKQLESVKK